VTALVEDLRSAIAEAADPERAPRMRAYMKSEMPFRGVSAVPLRRICREVLSVHRLETRASWELAVRTLWDEASYREERYAALALTGHRFYRDYQDAVTLDLYRHLVVTGAWWDLVDDIAAHRVGPILAADPGAVAPLVRTWARDDDLWVRRTAILCQLARKGATDVALLADVIGANLEGTAFGGEFFIRKAVGWALREYAKTDPAWVLAFVEEHAAAMSGLSRREALKNLA
jgi:3-methyladenine DNA glycosylase AlkD